MQSSSKKQINLLGKLSVNNKPQDGDVKPEPIITGAVFDNNCWKK
jgi:hypothetical protein